MVQLQDVPRQVAGTPRPPLPTKHVRYMQCRLFLGGQHLFTHRLAASYSSLVRAIRHVPGTILRAHYGAGLMVPIVLLVVYGQATVIAACEHAKLRTPLVSCLLVFFLCCTEPGSKVRYFREKIRQAIRVHAVNGLCVLRDTTSTRSISRFCTPNTAILEVFRGSKLWTTAVNGLRYSRILSVLQVFRDSVLLVLWILTVFRHLVLIIITILGAFQDLLLRGAAILAVLAGMWITRNR